MRRKNREENARAIAWASYLTKALLGGKTKAEAMMLSKMAVQVWGGSEPRRRITDWGTRFTGEKGSPKGKELYRERSFNRRDT